VVALVTSIFKKLLLQISLTFGQFLGVIESKAMKK